MNDVLELLVCIQALQLYFREDLNLFGYTLLSCLVMLRECDWTVPGQYE